MHSNALTIDVEDYFQVLAMAPYVARSEWEGGYPHRVEANIDKLLALLDEFGVRATFFVLGWVAERYPAAIRRIAAGGHELANHGYGHERVVDIGPHSLREDVSRAKGVLEDIAAQPVIGYRAPAFSIGPHTPWAFEILQETGHRYSSSVYPVHHDHYGTPSAPRFAHRTEWSQGMLEVPPATLRLGGRNWPVAGGGYFRLLPYSLSRLALQLINQGDNRSAVFYIHPWEVDPGQPRIPGINLKTRFRHYLNLQRTAPRLRRLLQDFRWARMDEVFATEIAASEIAAGQPEDWSTAETALTAGRAVIGDNGNQQEQSCHCAQTGQTEHSGGCHAKANPRRRRAA